MKDSFLDFNEKKWPLLKKDLKKIVGDTAYNNWLKQLSFISNKENTITLSVPTKFLRDWIVNNYSDKIKIECNKYIENIEAIKFVVKPVGGRVVPGTTLPPTGFTTNFIASIFSIYLLHSFFILSE